MKYDIVLQHSASKREWVITGLTDSGNELAYLFEDFEMPADAPDGEYYGLCFRNDRDDVEYTLKDVILDSIASVSDGTEVQLKYLRPEIFLMRYGEITSDASYRETDKQYYYRKKNG